MTDLIDTLTIDPATIALGAIIVDGKPLTPPTGFLVGDGGSFIGTLDLRPENDMLARVTVTLEHFQIFHSS